MADANGNGAAAANVAAVATQALATRRVPLTMANMKSSQVADIFGLYREQIQRAIPKTLTVERVTQLATTMITRNPDLLQCTTESLVGAVLQCSILGFEPIPQLGLVYFVPRKNKNLNGAKEIVFQLGYKGKIALARRSGEIETIYAQAVYSNDDFIYEFGLEPTLKHKPNMEDRGKMIAAYAVAKYVNGGYAFEVMSRHDIEGVRKRSASPNSGPWITDYDAMAKKTVVHRLSAYLPLSVEVMKLMQVDNAVVNIKPDTDPDKGSFGANGEGADLSKVSFVTGDGETGEATMHTGEPQTAAPEEAAEAANVVNEATGEITQQPAAQTTEEKYPNQLDLHAKNDAAAQSEEELENELFSALLKLTDAQAPEKDIKAWYSANLVQINSLKPAAKKKAFMDSVNAALAVAKGRG